MRTRKFIAAAAGIGILLVATAAVAFQEFDLPELLSADEQVPVAEPSEGQQVAVLKVDLGLGAQVVRAEVVSLEVIDSFAPKSALRDAGDWEVRVVGDRELSYRIPNPLTSVEVETGIEGAPYRTIPLQSFEWTLVVPLYHDGEPLNAKSIEVRDLRTGLTILRADVPVG
ncbi:MAG: hypothetical protein M3217_00925 [Actinomycetota bacterium]|nr:hypothetical protein [Actinomycetota bacterium]